MLKRVLCLFASVSLAATHVGAQQTAAQPSGSPVLAPPAPTALSPDEALTYRLGAGDKLHIITFDEPQLTGDFYVGSNGMVSLPMIGDVPARGRTETELRADVEARLRNGYILNPTISLQVLAFRPFYILGEVNKPGEYPYSSGLTVTSAVATAGGFTYRANTKNVFIKTAGDGSEVKRPASSATDIHAGDTIRVSERFF